MRANCVLANVGNLAHLCSFAFIHYFLPASARITVIALKPYSKLKNNKIDALFVGRLKMKRHLSASNIIETVLSYYIKRNSFHY